MKVPLTLGISAAVLGVGLADVLQDVRLLGDGEPVSGAGHFNVAQLFSRPS